MLAQNDIHRRLQLRETVVDHAPRTVHRLLGRLEERNKRSIPVVLALGEEVGGTQ